MSDHVTFLSPKYKAHRDYWTGLIPSHGSGFRLEPGILGNEDSSVVSTLEFRLSEATSSLLKGSKPMEGFITLCAGFSWILSYASGKPNITFHTPHLKGNAERSSKNESIAVNQTVSGAASMSDLLKTTKDVMQAAYQFGAYPTHLTEYDEGDVPFKSNIMLSANAIHEKNVPTADLHVSLESSCDTLRVSYRNSAFEVPTLETLLRFLDLILRVEMKEVPLHGLADELPRDERSILEGKKIKDLKSTLVLIDEAIKKHPGRVAITVGDEAVTYAMIDQFTRKLGSYFHSAIGEVKDLPVGLIMNRSMTAVLSILSVVRSGATYVPIDPNTPSNRLKEMIKIAGVQHLLSDQNTRVQGVVSHDVTWQSLKQIRTLGRFSAIEPNQLAYVIFTSGSSGTPKAVKVEHENLSNLIFGLCDFKELQASDEYVLSANFSFDASIKQLFAPLAVGATTHVLSDVSDMLQLAQLIERQLPASLHLSPAVWTALLNVKQTNELKFESLKKVSSGGDHMTAGVREQIRKNFPKAAIWNLYGPTETCINVAGQRLTATDVNPYVIGQPFPGVSIKILNKEGACIPRGLWGELVVSGGYVSAGYIANPSEDKGPFYEVAGLRHYRTGDYARINDQGWIELKGRMDRQVQVRGIRIEPGEIEETMLQVDNVTQAYVGMSTDESELLIGVFQSESVDSGKMIAHLNEVLPDTMIPDQLIGLSELPVNESGKIDLKAARDLQMNNRSDEASLNELEYRIARIWCKVLDLDFVNLSDDFFRIGGHSLAAMRMLFQLKVQMGLEVTLKEFYNHATLMAFSELVNSKLHTQGLTTTTERAFEDQDHYPVSHAQKRLWRLHQIDPDSLPAYNMAQCYRINGALEIELFIKTFENLVNRHHGLMTHFAEINDEVRQRITLGLPVAIDYLDLTTETQAEDIWKEAAFALNNHTFDLITGPLFKGHIFKIENDEYLLIFAISHIISDGWSTGIIASELKSLYNQVNLKPLTLQSKDFAVAESKSTNNDEVERYWLDQFERPSEQLDLPTVKSRPANRTYTGGIQSLYLPSSIRLQLLKKSTVLNTSLFITFLGMVQAFISRWTGAGDIILGVPFSGRTTADLENQIGCYVNMLAIRTQIEHDHQLNNILKAASNKATGAFENGIYPFDELLSKLSLQVHPSHSPLFDIVVFQEEYKGAVDALHSGLTFSEVPMDFGVSKYDLTISFKDDQDGLIVDFNYNQEIIDQDVVDKLVDGFGSFMKEGLDNPNLPLKDISILGDSEKGMIQRFSHGAIHPTSDKTIDELFQAVVEKHPYRVALTEKDLNLTYAHLDQKTDALCALLKQEYGVEKGTRVVIIAQTRTPYFLGMLASAKLGAIYVPLDSSWPEERILSVLEDSDPQLILTDLKEDTWGYMPTLDVLNRDLFKQQVRENKPSIHQKSDPLYIIFTSGTTGKPKGVIVPHAGMINLCEWHQRSFKLDSNTIATQYASPGFDAMGWEIWPYLLTGSRIEVIPDELKLDLPQLMTFYRKRSVTHTFLPTAIFEQLDAKDFQDVALQLTVLTGGDKLRGINQTLPVAFNCYGPTEYSVVATYDSITSKQEQITIGRPVDNTYIYILNNTGAQQPVKTPGEVCIGGDGLALGYWKDDDQTDLKFRMNESLSQRLYHTGDVAYWDNEGRIVYLHRDDNQIQIRGFRVEIGEIEQQLLRINRVTQCAVIAEESAEGLSLNAFYTALTATDVEEVRIQLERVLPYYMIPSKIVQVEQMPLTASGKIDRNTLLKLNSSEIIEQKISASEEEMELLAIWTNILPAKNIGIHTNFFEAGGDSIKAIQLAAKSKEIGYRIKVSDIYRHPTVAGLIRSFSRNHDVAVKIDQPEFARLTPIQTWLFQRPEEARHHFNQCVMFYDTQKHDEETLKSILQVLVEHHDALRLQFPATESQQQLTRPKGIHFDFHTHQCMDMNAKEIEKLAASCQQKFDVTEGPLVRLDVFQEAAGDHLLFTLHHLIVDGVSWRILMEDLAALFTQHKNGQNLQLKTTSDSYLIWSQSINNWANTTDVLTDAQYWDKMGSEITLNNPFPPGSIYKQEDRDYIQVQCSKKDTELLLGEANKAYQTQVEDLLLTVLVMTLEKALMINKVPVLLESHGRHELFDHVDINRTVGWFTNTYPVVLQASQGQVKETIIQTKEILRSIPQEGMAYGILKYIVPKEKLPNIDLGPDPVIAFNYLGQFDEDLEGADLRLSELDPGPTIGQSFPHDQCMTFTASVVDKQLEITFACDKKVIPTEIKEQIAATCGQFLHDIIEHCSNQNTVQYTPSDFEASNLDFEDLNSISEIYEN